MTFFDEYHAGHVDRAYDVSAALIMQREAWPLRTKHTEEKDERITNK